MIDDKDQLQQPTEQEPLATDTDLATADELAGNTSEDAKEEEGE